MRMNALSRVLAFKIAVTTLFWCVPLLFFPTPLLLWLGFPVPEPQIFLRLLGMAYSALVLGYCFGLRSTLQGVYPSSIVWVGLLSNGGAFAILAIGAVSGAWQSWGSLAQALMWGSLFATGAIAGTLAWFGPLRNR